MIKAKYLLQFIFFWILALAGSQLVLSKDDARKVLYWVAPMDPNYKRDKPGKSPMGMDLVPVYKDAQKTKGGEIIIAPQVIQNLGVRTALVERSRLWRKINTVGFAGYDESRLSHIHLRTRGWIENLTIRSEGERVKKGQLLFKLYSPELVNAQEEYLRLLPVGNKALVNASKERLIALGISSFDIEGLHKDQKARQKISVYAPQDGVVSLLKAREGMYVKPENQIATLADLSSIWVLAEVFEHHSSWVEAGQPAEVRFAHLPGKIFGGNVEYIYPTLDPVTRTLGVRLRFANPDEMLKPNMFGDVSIYAGAKQNIMVVPRESVIRTGHSERVIIAKGEGRFEVREVVAGIESGDWIEIQAGLSEAQRVVVSGQFLIDSEASTQASFTRMAAPAMRQAGAVEQAGNKAITGLGTVESVDLAQQKLRISHEPIDALGWPSMQMDFKISRDYSLDQINLQAGERITFTLVKIEDRYEISSIERIDQ